MKKLSFFLIFVFAFACDTQPIDVTKELETVRVYAEHYDAKSSDAEFPIVELKMPPKNVIDAIHILARSKTREHEQYIYLIILKHFRNDYEYGHQSYELRDRSGHWHVPKNPIVKEYCRLVGINPRFVEFLPSGDIYERLEKYPGLMTYPPLALEMAETRKLINYWQQQFERDINSMSGIKSPNSRKE